MSTPFKPAILCLLLGWIILPLAAVFPGNCLYFEQGDYVTGTGITTSLSAVSIECWVKHDALPISNQRYLTLKGEVAVLRAENGGVLKFFIKQSNGTLASVSTPVLAAGEWLHVAGTYNGSTLRIYLNGLEVGSATAGVGGLAALNGGFDIGSSGESMRGCIDDLRVWNTARTQAQIKGNRFQELTGAESGLIHYWKMDEGSGTLVADSKGGANGTMYNMTNANWLVSTVPTVTSGAPGNALSFDGMDDNVKLQKRTGLPVFTSGSAYSVSFWVKGAPQQNYLYAEASATSGEHSQFYISGDADGKLLIYILNTANTLNLMAHCNMIVLDDTWHHVCWSDNNGTATLFIDGIPDTYNFNYTRSGTFNMNTCTIGAKTQTSTGGFFNGQIDDFSIWSANLSQAQVRDYLHSTKTGGEANLVAYYQMDAASGGVCYDIANGNNGIMYYMSDASCVSSTAFIGQTFTGNISSSTTWNYPNTLYVNSDVTITNNATLTVSPGTTIFMSSECRMLMDSGSRLLAVGTVSDSIRFTGFRTTGWHGINIYNLITSGDSTQFVYCRLEHGTTTNEYAGNAMDYHGGALSIYQSHKILIKNCTFQYNKAQDGGAVYIGNSYARIENCVFKNNTATANGGAVSYKNCNSSTLYNCSFIKNTAFGRAGGFYLNSPTNANSVANCVFYDNSADSGGGISISSTSLANNINNCTVINNSATTGGGIELIGTINGTNLRNIAIWGNMATNGSAVAVSGSVTANFYYCDVQGGYSDIYLAAGGSLAGSYSNCFELDPLVSYSFTNPASGFTMAVNSPCINAGDPSTSLSGAALRDINSELRFYDNTSYTGNLNIALDRIDCGALENSTGSVVIPHGTVLEQDYAIQSDLYLHLERTLTVNAGLTISFASEAHANISGNLNAIGTPTSRITFTEAVSGTGWRGFTFSSTGNAPYPSSVLEWCIINKGSGDTGNEAWGGNIHVWYYNELLLRNCVIEEGLAEVGGAIYTRNSSVKMINCVMSGNACTIRGTGFYSDNSSVQITNCTIAGNYKTGDQSDPSTWAVLYFTNIGIQPQITNCIIWNNGSSPIHAEGGGGTLTNLTYCDVEGGYSGTGNINVDPRFTGEAGHPFNLERWSYCINAARADTTGLSLPVVDLKNDNRIYSHANTSFNRVDMGAYEYQGYLCPADFTASDGNNNYPGYVYMTWNFNPAYNLPVNGFRVIRNGNNLETVGSGTFSYSDYNALPGTIYNYSVEAYYGSETGLSAEDSGYIKPNGVISGHVKTTNNNPVVGVKITLNPSQGQCLQMNADSMSRVSTANPQANLNQNFTLELWIKTTSSSLVLLSSANHQLKITSTGLVQYTDDTHTLTQTDTTIYANDGEWRHLAVVNNFTDNKVLLYINEHIVASQTGIIFGNYTPSGFEVPVGITGFIDDLRVWSAVRDSSEVADAMNIVVPYDSPGLKAYWAMNEGTGITLFDATTGAHNATVYSCTWSSSDPGMRLGALTNNWGDYMISEIPYGSSTNFTVTPSKPGHMFQPEQRLVTLSSSNIAANDIDFTDNSMIPISGYIKYQGTICPVVNATIWLNGAQSLPLVMTNEDGYYLLEVEHGTECLVSANFNNHTFNREWNLGTVSYPRTNINFEDSFRTEFWLEVVGGVDSYPIGDFNVSMASRDGRYDREITNANWSTGRILVPNVVPLDYNVTVNPGASDPFALAIDDQFQSMKTKRFNQLEADAEADTLRYEWRAPLEIGVVWPDSMQLKYFPEYPNKGFHVVYQNEWYEVEVRAFEDYSFDGHPNQKSYLTDCDVMILDEVGPEQTIEDNFAGEDYYAYQFAPYLPNINGGYDRQYQKQIGFMVNDQALNRNVACTQWCLTQGVKPLESTYATTSPQIPFLILHDPPGDASFASYQQSSSHAFSMSTSVCNDQEQNGFFTLHLGHDYNIETGTVFFSKGTEWKWIFDLGYELSVEKSQTNSREQTFSLTTSQTYTTSAEGEIIGDGADLFVGGALNLVWGLTKELSWDDEYQQVVLEDNVMVTPNGFETIYLYTDLQIRNSIIPNCLAIGDTASANLWQSYLDQNEYNKAHAVVNPNHPGNLSFNAGAGYTYEETNSCETTVTHEFETTVSNEFGLQIGFIVDGTGFEGGYKFKTKVTTGGSEATTTTNTTTTAFTLGDDDETSDLTSNADYFTVDIKKDPVYGTPVFSLVSGASSCPWEPNTQPRDGVMMTANTYTATNVPQDQPALFMLYLSNTSQTNEPRRYYLSVMHATNTVGATVKINGVPLENAMAFDLDGGQTTQVALMVEPGPFGYELEGLILEFYALGDRGNDGPDGHYFDVFKSFNIYWEPPYSRVAIQYPQENWLLNQAQNDTLQVMLRDYDLSKPDFESVIFEYKHPQDITWLPGFEVPRSVLEDHPFYIVVPWDVSTISDGIYEIRAGTTDAIQANWYTHAITGRIDRSAPQVWGLPQPADGILSPGDCISVSFNENIDPMSVIPGRITVVAVGDPLVVDFDAQCYANTISIVPRIANYWIENKNLRVTVQDLTDLAGNPMMEPVQWEFFVNANPVNWNSTKVEVVKPLGESGAFTSVLINTGGQTSSFTLDGLPVWLNAYPLSGTLLPLDSCPISFTISDQLGFGVFTDTLWADIPALGREPLVVKVSVLANPPAWAYTVTNNYEYSMTITGSLSINGEISTDPNDIIGAFIQHQQGAWECSGVATPEYVGYQGGSWQFFLTIQNDEEEGGEILFKVWDASNCKEHFGIDEEFTFYSGMVHGTPLEPVTLHASEELIQSISCSTGWTWLSTNLVDQQSMALNHILSSLNTAPNDIIKSQTQFAQYTTANGWIGSLESLETTRMYKLKLQNQSALQIIGLLEDPDAVAINYGSGWNWISYLPHVSISVAEALANISNLVSGDLVKNQRGYAQYIEGYGWVGSLRFMKPGEGYLLKTANSGSFHYPDYQVTRTWQLRPEPAREITVPGWNLDPLAWEYSANITAVIQQNGLPAPDNYVVGAFVGSECRGIAGPLEVMGGYMYFLTVYANTFNETLSFMVYDTITQNVYDLSNTLTFVNNQVTGNPTDPYVFLLTLQEYQTPQNLQIVRLNNTFKLTWDPVPGAISYRVYTSPNPYADDPVWTLAATNLEVQQWIDPNPGSLRFYRITAVFIDLRGNSQPFPDTIPAEKPSTSMPNPDERSIKPTGITGHNP